MPGPVPVLVSVSVSLLGYRESFGIVIVVTNIRQLVIEQAWIGDSRYGSLCKTGGNHTGFIELNPALGHVSEDIE